MVTHPAHSRYATHCLILSATGEALNETYERVAKQFEKGRVAATKEMKKAETVFMKKLHEIEAKVLKKAGEIKKNMNK